MTVPAYRLLLPAEWQALPLGDGRDEAISSIARDAVVSFPRDSAAATRHRYERRLHEIAESLATESSAVMDVVYFPRARSGADLVPMTVSCGRLPEMTIASSQATKFLVGMAQSNDTAKPVDADGVVALRTHSFADAGVPIAAEVQAMSGEAVDHVELRQLRASYVFAEPEGASWHLVVASATLPPEDDETPVADALLELFDAVMATLRWSAQEVAHA